MFNQSRPTSLVRIFSPTGVLVGSGFFFTPRRLLCAARSIWLAFGKSQPLDEIPDLPVPITLSTGNVVSATVIAWHPPRPGSDLDGAVLELDSSDLSEILSLAALDASYAGTLQTIGYLTANASVKQAIRTSIDLTAKIIADFPSIGGCFPMRIVSGMPGFSLNGSLGAPVTLGNKAVGLLNWVGEGTEAVLAVAPLELFLPVFNEFPARLPDQKQGNLHLAPVIPYDYQPRPVEETALRQALMEFRGVETGRNGGAFGTTAFGVMSTTGPIDSLRSDRVVLHGNPGTGKTSLAARVLAEPIIRRVYSDGIFWLNFGEEPDLLGLQTQLASMLGDPNVIFEDTRQGRRVLRRMLVNKACIIVLDDVWQGDDARTFDCVGPKGMLLVIGRKTGLVGTLHAVSISLDLMDGEAAANLFSNIVNLPANIERSSMDLVFAQAARSPLAIRLLGGILKANPLLGEKIAKDCSQVNLQQFTGLKQNNYFPSLISALDVAVRYLPADIRDLFKELGIFPAGVAVPVAAISRLWESSGVDRVRVQEITRYLFERGLLQLDLTDKPGFVYLHDFVTAYLRMDTQENKNLQARFVRSYGALPPASDKYILANLLRHLIAAGMIDEIKKLLLNFRFLSARQANGGLGGLYHDYTLALRTPGLSLWDRDVGSEGLLLIQTAIRQSSRLIGSSVNALAAQLCGRLLGLSTEPGVNDLLTSIRRELPRPRLLPLTHSLNWPGKPELLNLSGHSGSVRVVVVTLDGQFVLSASEDRTIRIWDLDTGVFVSDFRGHDRIVTCLAATPDGQHALSGDEDGRLILWRIRDSQEIARMDSGEFSKGRIVALSVSADGRRAVVCYSNRAIDLWNLETFRRIRTYQIDDALTEAVLILPGSLQAASAGRTITIWDLETGQTMMRFQGHTGDVKDLKVSTDGQRLISAADDRTVRIWNIQTGDVERILTNHAGTVRSVVQIPGTKLLASGGKDPVVHIWEMDSGREVKKFPSHGGNVRSLAVTPDGRRLISGGDDRRICVWAQSDPRLLSSLSGPTARNSAVVLTPDGKQAISAGADGAIRLWDLAGARQVRLLQVVGSMVHALATTSDGKIVCAARADGQLNLIDSAGKLPSIAIPAHSRAVFGVAFTPDGKRLVAASEDHTLSLYQILPPTSDNELVKIEFSAQLGAHSSFVRAVACLPDNWRAVSVSSDGTLSLWDLETRRLLYTLQAHNGEINDVAVLNGGKFVVTAGDDQWVKVWDVEKGHPQYRLRGHQAEVNAVAATLDGLRIVTVSNDRSVRIWDLPKKREVRLGSEEDLFGKVIEPVLPLEDHSEWIHTVAITSDGMRVITASEDTTLKIWDISPSGQVSMGRKPESLPSHAKGAATLSISVDGRYGLSGGGEGDVQYWHFERGKSALIEKCTPKDRIHQTSGVTELRFFPDGIHFAAAYSDRVIRIWNLDYRTKAVRNLVGHTSTVRRIAITADGRKLCSIGEDIRQAGRSEGILRVWDVASGKLEVEFPDTGAAILALEPLAGARLVAGVLADGRFFIWDLYRRQTVYELRLIPEKGKQYYQAAEFDPQSNILALVENSGKVCIYNISAQMANLARGAEHYPFDMPQNERKLTFSEFRAMSLVKNGQQLAVVAGSSFSLWDTETNERIAHYQTDSQMISCSGSKSGNLYLVGDQRGEVHVLSYE